MNPWMNVISPTPPKMISHSEGLLYTYEIIITVIRAVAKHRFQGEMGGHELQCLPSCQTWRCIFSYLRQLFNTGNILQSVFHLEYLVAKFKQNIKYHKPLPKEVEIKINYTHETGRSGRRVLCWGSKHVGAQQGSVHSVMKGLSISHHANYLPTNASLHRYQVKEIWNK